MARLPLEGRWQLVDPRWTMGLMGGDGPPFGILAMNFLSKQGTARYWVDESPLSGVSLTGPDSFAAAYALRGKSGEFKARLRDDGELEMEFHKGSAILKCRGVVRDRVAAAVNRMAILTCVGQHGHPSGPGHTALIGDSNVFSFENATSSPLTGRRGWAAGAQSGWLIAPTKSYLGLPGSLARPIVIQELDATKVNFSKVMDYIDASISNDDDYATSGVCSQQAASALAAGISGGFNPSGVDTPWKVYDKAKSMRIVTATYRIWDTSKTAANLVPDFVAKLASDYFGVAAPTGPDVTTW